MSLGGYSLAKERFEHALTLVKQLSDNLAKVHYLTTWHWYTYSFQSTHRASRIIQKHWKLPKPLGINEVSLEKYWWHLL